MIATHKKVQFNNLQNFFFLVSGIFDVGFSSKHEICSNSKIQLYAVTFDESWRLLAILGYQLHFWMLHSLSLTLSTANLH